MSVASRSKSFVVDPKPGDMWEDITLELDLDCEAESAAIMIKQTDGETHELAIVWLHPSRISAFIGDLALLGKEWKRVMQEEGKA